MVNQWEMQGGESVEGISAFGNVDSNGQQGFPAMPISRNTACAISVFAMRNSCRIQGFSVLFHCFIHSCSMEFLFFPWTKTNMNLYGRQQDRRARIYPVARRRLPGMPRFIGNSLCDSRFLPISISSIQSWNNSC
ncbi:MAG: hypothetical protein LBO00_06360 [Zoogloeaceae bacterium]|nr:hypothetical protein [Zoogloeaceae bacterium]